MKGSNVFVEFHALTSHVPANLNRDELGTPKTALFGGVRRLRISSQCLKRTWRMSEFFRGALAESELGVRTATLPEILRGELEADGLSADAIDGFVALLQAIGRRTGDAGSAGTAEQSETAASDDARPEAHTAHLLFLSKQEIDEVGAFARANKAKLEKVYETKKGKKAVAKKELDKLRKGLQDHLRQSCKRNAVDVALFGRFITSDEISTVDAAMQVAHAIGTQQVEVEYDYFSAVDDWSPERGAGHIGESEFASSVFYKYAVCDLALLRANLGGDVKLAAKAMKGLASAVARAVPRGKSTSTAPQNPADYLEIVVRRDAPVSLANAFLRPIRATADHDVMDASILALRQQAERYAEAYGDDVIARYIMSLRDLALPGETTAVGNMTQLASEVETVVGSVELPATSEV